MAKTQKATDQTTTATTTAPEVTSDKLINKIESKDAAATHDVPQPEDKKIKATFDVEHVTPAPDSADGKKQIAVNLEGVGQVVLPKIEGRRQYAVSIKGIGKVLINIKQFKDGQGRPTNPNSERQKRLAAQEQKREALKAQGITMGRGREVDPNSARQIALRKRADEMSDEAVAAMQGTDLYKELKVAGKMTEQEIRVAILGAGETKLSRGRNVDLNSDRQKQIRKRVEALSDADREVIRAQDSFQGYMEANDGDEDLAIQAMMTSNELKGVFERGRPKLNNDVVEVETPVLVLQGDDVIPMVN